MKPDFSFLKTIFGWLIGIILVITIMFVIVLNQRDNSVKTIELTEIPAEAIYIGSIVTDGTYLWREYYVPSTNTCMMKKISHIDTLYFKNCNYRAK